MSPGAVCRTHYGFARKAGVVVLVCGLINVSLPAFADEVPSRGPSSTFSRSSTTDLLAPISPTLLISARVREALAQSAALEARRLASDAQTGGTDTSNHWCAGGLALLAGGVAAAAVSWTRRDPNPQKPNPPVGVVLGAAAGVVGAVTMAKTCRH